MRRTQPEDHAADEGFADRVGTKGTRLRTRVDFAVFKAHGTERFLRLRNGRRFGMSRHIAVMRDLVDRLGHDHAITADHCGIWILTRFAGCLRKADAMAHHQAIDFLNVHTPSVAVADGSCCLGGHSGRSASLRAGPSETLALSRARCSPFVHHPPPTFGLSPSLTP